MKSNTSEKQTTAGAWSQVVAGARRVLRGTGGASATLQTLLVQGLIIILNLATGILSARYLGAVGRGEMSAIEVWPSLLEGLMTLGIPSALIYNFRRHPEQRARLFGAALVMGAVGGLGVALAGAALVPYWMDQYPAHIIHASQLLVLTVPVGLVGLICVGALKARDEFSIVNGLHLSIPLLTLVGLVGLVATETMTPISGAVAYIITGPALSLWPLRRLWQRIGPRFDDLWQSGQRLLRYGLRSWGIDVLSTLALKIDRALVVGLLAPEAMGLYVVALSAASVLRVVQKAIQTVLFPKAASRPTPEVMAMTGRSVRFNVALTGIIGGVFYVLGPYLLGWVYGPSFAEGATVLRILIGQVMLVSTTMVLAQAFMALDRPGVVTMLQALGVAISVPLLAVLVPQYGLEGAGWALLLSAAVRFITILACFPLLLDERVPSFMLTLDDLRFVYKRFSA